MTSTWRPVLIGCSIKRVLLPVKKLHNLTRAGKTHDNMLNMKQKQSKSVVSVLFRCGLYLLTEGDERAGARAGSLPQLTQAFS